MKKITISFLCLLCSFLAFSQTPTNVILLLNFGQSNVVGRAQPDPPNEVPPTPGTYWYKQSTNTLEQVIDGVGEGVSHATDRSMNPMLCKRLKELTGMDVIIVPAGIGNTFIRNWLKEDNSLYTRAKLMWQDAITYCNAHNITIANKYAHWLQGENDAGVTAVDGYYVMLNQLVNDVINDLGIEKMFATRIGYDPHYTSAANSESIMKAQKLLNFNNPNFIMASYAPPTFTVGNGKMATDLTHHTLLGMNQTAEDVAQAILYYRTTGNKIGLTENVASLQPVTNGYINLTPNWSFDFNNSIAEANDNVTMGVNKRDWVPYTLPSYTSEGVIIEKNKGLRTSRPFVSDVFTVEMRFKMTSATGWTAPMGNGAGGHNNKLMIAHDTANSSLFVQLGTGTQVFSWDLGSNSVNMGNFHTFKFTQANGILKFYLDGVQVGNDQASTGSLTLSCVGMSTESHTFDMEGVIDFFKIKNSVDNNSTLPIKFKSFKATNIK